MSENSSGNSGEEKRTITAIELAELVIQTTSTLIPLVYQMDGDEALKKKIADVLTALQKKAIEYTIAAAKRANRRRSTWRARSPGRTWK